MKQSDIALAILLEAPSAVPIQRLKSAGVSGETLRRLVDAGAVHHVASGYYAADGKIAIDHQDWVGFALQAPEGVFGLMTAANHHGLCPDNNHVLQAFVPRTRFGKFKVGGASQAVVDIITSRNNDFLTVGVEEVVKSHHTTKVTSKERTLVDMFLFSPFCSRATERSVRVPDETFLETLNRCQNDDNFSFDEVYRIARHFDCHKQLAPFTKTAKHMASRGISAQP